MLEITRQCGTIVRVLCTHDFHDEHIEVRQRLKYLPVHSYRLESERAVSDQLDGVGAGNILGYFLYPSRAGSYLSARHTRLATVIAPAVRSGGSMAE
jgi:hypothetical protein